MYFNIFLYTHTHHCSVWYCVILYSYIIMHELHTELHCSVQMCSQGTVPWELQLDLCSGVSITAVNTRGYVHGRTCMCMYGCVCLCLCVWVCLCVCQCTQMPGVGGCGGATPGCGSPGSAFKSGTELGTSWRKTPAETHQDTHQDTLLSLRTHR